MSITIDLPPAVMQEATSFAERRKTTFAQFLLESIENVVRDAEEKKIYLVGILFPQSPAYKETGAYGRYGLRRSVAIKVIDRLYQLEKKYPHFRLMDENRMGDHDYDDEMAMNYDHLSYKGAERLTTRLDSLIRTLE